MAVTADYGAGRRAPVVGHVLTFPERWRRSLLLFVACELVVLFAPTVTWLVDRWTLSVWQNAHGVFVPPLAAWMAWEELRGRRDLPRSGSAWGFAFLLPALFLHAVDAGLHTQLISAIGLFLAVPGLSLLLLGRARTRLIAFPIAFLALAVPIPLVFSEPVTIILRHIAAQATAFVLPKLGIFVFLEGTTLQMTLGSVIIADACSGFSTLYASVAAASFIAYTACSRRRRAFVLLAAAPVAIGANILRVVALALMVGSGKGWLLDTFVHPLSGMLTFALALPMLFWIGGPARDST